MSEYLLIKLFDCSPHSKNNNCEKYNKLFFFIKQPSLEWAFKHFPHFKSCRPYKATYLSSVKQVNLSTGWGDNNSPIKKDRQYICILN